MSSFQTTIWKLEHLTTRLVQYSDGNCKQMMAVIMNIQQPDYSGDLITGLVWYSNGQKLSDRRMVRYSNAIWIPDK